MSMLDLETIGFYLYMESLEQAEASSRSQDLTHSQEEKKPDQKDEIKSGN